MKPFIHENFLLDTPLSRRLYHDVAEGLPVIDYHSHLPPRAAARDERFSSLTDLWLESDHYKWRALRTAGVEERLITGDAPPEEKFAAWARTVPLTLGNPLFVWTHLELARFFGVFDPLNPATAAEVLRRCNDRLSAGEITARSILRQCRAEVVCTTDDPADDLEYHRRHAEAGSPDILLLPAWRADGALKADDPEVFNRWVDRLGEAADVETADIEGFLRALEARHTFFHQRGCRLADYGIAELPALRGTEEDAAAVFRRLRAGESVRDRDLSLYLSWMLFRLLEMDRRSGWTAQLHYGVLRNVNSAAFRALGPDTGFDAMGDGGRTKALAVLLDRLAEEGGPGRMVLYPANPADYYPAASLIGAFQGAGTAGRLQLGPAWWFLDQTDGIERQLVALAGCSLLGTFVGMTTDSRSFLSFSRHEYFRRIFCRFLGHRVASGEYPEDVSLLADSVSRVCYTNARDYFRFEKPV